jgi:hypothetical protein
MKDFPRKLIAVAIAMSGGYLLSTYAPLSRWPKTAAVALAVGLLMAVMLTLLPRPRQR